MPKFRAPLLSWRRAPLLFFTLLLFYCLNDLGFEFNKLPPSADPISAAKTFFSAALEPAFADQNPSLPADTAPLLKRIGISLATTVRYAFIAMSMAVPAGLLLGFMCSRSWWPTAVRSSTGGKIFHTLYLLILNTVYLCVRFFITFLRSIHELIWVILFMSFLGDSPLTACIALALPFTGTLAKVFSEIIDEQPKAASEHIRLAGGSSIQSFLFTRLPQALPDILTYTLYRLECAIRSSAVLGFVGIETIGLTIKQSYENTYYNEVWTEIYALILIVMFFDILGSVVRKKLHNAPLPKQTANNSLKQLKRNRPKSLLLRSIWLLLGLGVFAAWNYGPELNEYHSYLTRMERFEIFVDDITPEPVRTTEVWADAIPWAEELFIEGGREALASTLILATSALLLATLFGYTLAPWASRNISTTTPFGLYMGDFSSFLKPLWWLWGFLLRFLFLVSRSIPEYILAFLLIGVLGAHAWPLVIALAVHNFGILGRLWSEVSENHNEKIAKQQILTGASRSQSYLCGIIPTNFNRQLLFIFYRWETCVRESTILGMLSISSLGYLINTEWNFFRYDTMLFYILLGTVTIFLCDIFSVALRAKMKKS